jgi:hypothetical protein
MTPRNRRACPVRFAFQAFGLYITAWGATCRECHMRAVLLGVALTLVAGPAWAQSCTTYGTKTICDNGFTAQRVGKTTTFSDGTMAFRSGNMTMYSNGTSSFRVGNTTTFSNGVTAHEFGNVITFSNGRACNRLGNTVSCY